MGQLEDEYYVDELIDANPDIKKRIDANADAYAQTCKRKENQHMVAVGVQRGVPGMTTAATMSLSRGAQLPPAPAQGGLMLPPRPKKRRAGE